jgi:hypothetical protein
MNLFRLLPPPNPKTLRFRMLHVVAAVSHLAKFGD